MLRRLWSSRPYAIDLGLLMLRVSSAFLIMTHGWPKLIHFTERAQTFQDPIGLGSTISLSLALFAEFFCGAFLMIGLFSRIVLIPMIINMMVIVFIVHGPKPLGDKELSLFYLISFVLLFLSGPGRYSADNLLKK